MKFVQLSSLASWVYNYLKMLIEIKKNKINQASLSKQNIRKNV